VFDDSFLKSDSKGIIGNIIWHVCRNDSCVTVGVIVVEVTGCCFQPIGVRGGRVNSSDAFVCLNGGVVRVSTGVECVR
jgi:hypothetical protein